MKNCIILASVILALTSCAANQEAKKPVEDSAKVAIQKATTQEIELADDAFNAGNILVIMIRQYQSTEKILI